VTADDARRELDDEIAEFDEASVVDETAEPAEPPDEEPAEFEDSTGESFDRKLEREEPDAADEGPVTADELSAPSVRPDPSEVSLLDVDPARPHRREGSAEEAAMHKESRDGGRRGR
jgi:hypothetical protein